MAKVLRINLQTTEAGMAIIWHHPMTLDEVQASRKDTMVDHLGIEFTGYTDSTLSAKMPVDSRTLQPNGILHGGASCALAETVGSVAGNYTLDQQKFTAVGLEINTSHVRMIKEGWIYATATPLHLGKTTQLWEIPIIDGNGRLISMNRLRLMVISLTHAFRA